MSRLKRGTQEEFDSFVRRMDLEGRRAIGNLVRTKNVDAFSVRIVRLLEDLHVGAIWRGRILGGDRSRIDFPDRYFARQILEEQITYFEDFLAKIDAGFYTRPDGSLSYDAIQNRLRYYIERARGSANDAFLAASGNAEEWDWLLGPAEHCDDCLIFASLSPLRTDQLWTTPGGCQTACKSKCKCRLKRRSDGKDGFAFVRLYRQAEIVELFPAA